MTFERLEKEIGYTFRDKALLKTAFVHSTYANAHGGEDNERLEFLGDSVLQLVVSEMLYFREKKGKTLSEGEMTALRQALVRKEALLEAAEKLSLKNFLLVEGGKRTSAARRFPACSRPFPRPFISTAAMRRQSGLFSNISP